MARHSFIQMSKLSNVKGRISYVSDPKRQEHLYATFATREDMTFWNDLAKECQEEFKRYGTEGKCIEARELIIALPEEYTQFDPNRVLREFTEQFKKRYDVEERPGRHVSRQPPRHPPLRTARRGHLLLPLWPALNRPAGGAYGLRPMAYGLWLIA